ncbi:MAG: ATP-binding protein [Marinifilaceae bacterium]
MKTLSQLINEYDNLNKPKLTYADLLKKREEDNKHFIDELAKQKGKSSLELLVGRSGILPLHKDCTVNNFIANTPEQKRARQFAHFYALNFSKDNGTNFILSGESRTGKNHLSAAICSKLIKDGKSCLIITITDLMIKMRKCYGDKAELTEDEFINSLIKLDLLVIDEIGLQRKNDNEMLLLNQIVDQRTGHLKPTGMLTNLNSEDLGGLLGVRIMNRMQENGGQWVAFNWPSFKK